MPGATHQLRDAYDPFALIYNRGMAEDFCRRAFPAIDSLLLSQLPRHARILDLCCGTGQMARELSQLGYRVTGLDSSEQMIRIARDNVPGADFILADARSFTFAPTFDAVISTFNSLAHAENITELSSILGNAHSALNPNGLMLFDVSMEDSYTSKWHGSFGEAQPDVAWIVHPTYSRQSHSAQNDVTVFRRVGLSWERDDFTITQRCFSESEIRAALSSAGSKIITTYDAERDLGMPDEFGRRFFLCR